MFIYFYCSYWAKEEVKLCVNFSTFFFIPTPPPPVKWFLLSLNHSFRFNDYSGLRISSYRWQVCTRHVIDSVCVLSFATSRMTIVSCCVFVFRQACNNVVLKNARTKNMSFGLDVIDEVTCRCWSNVWWNRGYAVVKQRHFSWLFCLRIIKGKYQITVNLMALWWGWWMVLWVNKITTEANKHCP